MNIKYRSFSALLLISMMHNLSAMEVNSSPPATVTAPLHEQSAHHVAFSPDGTKYASGTGKGELYVFETKSNNLLCAFPGDGKRGITSLCWRADNRYLAVSSNDATFSLCSIYIADTLEQKVYDSCMQPNDQTNALSVYLSVDNNYLVSAFFPASVYVFGLKGDKWGDNYTGSSYTFKTSKNYIPEICCSLDSTLVAACSGNTIEIWNLMDPESSGLTLLGHTDDVLSIAFSPDGENLTSGSKDKTIKIWDLKTKECLHTLHGHTDTVSSVCYGKNGTFIASGSYDTTIKLWDIEKDFHVIETIKCDTKVLQISVSTNRILAGFPDGYLAIYDINKINECIEHNTLSNIKDNAKHKFTLSSLAFSFLPSTISLLTTKPATSTNTQ